MGRFLSLILGLVLIVVFCPTHAASGDVTFQERSRWGNSKIEHLVRHGSYVLAAKGLNGLDVFDVSNPALPVHVKTLALPGQVKALLVIGDVLYAIFRDGGLAAIDITNPAQARGVSHLKFDRRIYAMGHHGNHLLIPTFHGELHLVDISDPLHPVDAAQIYLGLNLDISSIVVTGDTAYLGAHNGLYAVDLAGATGNLRFHIDADGFRSVNSYKGYLVSYQTIRSGELYLPQVQIHQPTADGLDLVGSLLIPVSATVFAQAAVWGDMLTIPLGDAGLALVDLSNPAQPVVLDRVPFDGRLSHFDPVNGVYLSSFKGWGAVDVTQPTAPVLGPAFDPPQQLGCPVLVNNHFFVLDYHSDTMRSFDLNDAGDFTALGEVAMPRRIYHLEAIGNEWLLADDGFPRHVGPWLIDISDPLRPTVAADLALDDAFSTRVSGNLGVFYDISSLEADGMKIIDLTDPLQPQWIGESSTGPHSLLNLAFHGANAHLLVEDDPFVHSVLNFDFRNPVGATHPYTELMLYNLDRVRAMAAGPNRLSLIDRSRFLVHDFSGATSVNERYWFVHQPKILAMTAVGNMLVTVSRLSMSILDTTNPLKPRLLSQTPITGNGSTYAVPAVYLKDQVVIIAFKGVESFDISNPHHPKRLGGMVGDNFRVSQMHGDRLVGFASDQNQVKLQVVDVANPAAPRMVSETMMPLEDIPVFDFENNLLVSLATAKDPGLVYDLTRVEQPVLVQTVADLAGSSIDMSDGYAYVADSDKLMVYGVTADETVLESTLTTGLTFVRESIRDGDTLVVHGGGTGAWVDLARAGVPVIQEVRALPAFGPVLPFANPLFAGYGTTLRSYDLSDSQNPALMGQYDFAQQLENVFDLGSVVVIDRGTVAAVYDLSDPEGIIELATIPLDCYLTGAVWRDRQLVISDCGKLRVLDMRWLENLVEDWPVRSVLDMIHPLDLFPPVR